MSRLQLLRSPLIRTVRGRGLMLAIELHPETGGAYKYCESLRDQGVLVKDTQLDTLVDTLRLAPPLIIRRAEIDLIRGAVSKVPG